MYYAIGLPRTKFPGITDMYYVVAVELYADLTNLCSRKKSCFD